MEYVEYMGLPDDLFFVEVFKLYDERDKHRFQFLMDRPFIMDRFKNLISNKFIKGDKKRSAINFIKCYDSYVILSNIFDVIDEPLKFSNNERIRIFNSYNSFCGDKRGLKLFSKDEIDRINHVINGYDISKGYNEKNNSIIQYEKKYNNIISILKNILKFYSKHGDSNKFYSLLYDDMRIKQTSFSTIVKYTKIFFYQSLCSGTNILNKNILADLSFNEIYLLEKIDNDFSKIFNDYKFKVNDLCTSISDYEKLFKLFDRINISLSRRKGLEYTVGYVSNDLKITLDEMENYYYSVFKSFCNFKLNDFECDSNLKEFINNRKFKFLDISNFSTILGLYRELTHRSIYLIDLLCSDRKNMKNLIRMIYEIKFFNKVTPSMNGCYLASRIRFLDEREKSICDSFVAGYKKYYNSKKDFLEEEKRQSVNDNEVNNMDSYVTNVRLFLDSGCESIDSYFGDNVDDKKAFEFSLRVLKRHGNPIYQEYVDYMLSSNEEKNNRMIGDCKEIVRLINNGVLESDGGVRDFDLVDFYLYTDLNRKRFMNVIRDNVSCDEYASVSRFFSKYKGEKRIEGNMIDELYSSKVLFPNEWDSDGNVISYYDVTKEDKMDAIITIGKMGIPLTTVTYGIILRDSFEKNINKKNLTKRKKRV